MSNVAMLLSPATTARRPFVACSSSFSKSRATSSGVLRAAGRLASLRPSHQQKLKQRTLLCRAEGGPQTPQDNGEQQAEAGPASSNNPPTSAPQTKRPPVEDPSVAKGQRTAIITGAISIVFGVIYLALVFFLDMRGGELVPPPPEAYGL